MDVNGACFHQMQLLIQHMNVYFVARLVNELRRCSYGEPSASIHPAFLTLVNSLSSGRSCGYRPWVGNEQLRSRIARRFAVLPFLMNSE